MIVTQCLIHMYNWISEMKEDDEFLWLYHTNSPLARCMIFSYNNSDKVCPKCLAGEPEWQPVDYFPISDKGTMCHESTFI